MKPTALGAATAAILALSGLPGAAASMPGELGQVRFGRDLGEALAAAKKLDRPVLILFDEVPGCATCQGFGEAVLSHPLVVEAAETLFVPVAIYNNLKGKDAEALEAFGEPSWNNPVVRIVAADRRELAPRVDGDYTPAGLARAMVTALQASEKPVPRYLELLSEQASAEKGGLARAVLSMGCFWQGEACLGGIDGVVATRTGSLQGQEVVEVEFDPSRLGYEALLGEAKKMGCMNGVFVRTDSERETARRVVGEAAVSKTNEIFRASKNDDKHSLGATDWRFVPMIRIQAARANALLAKGADPSALFSSRQLEIRRSGPRQPALDPL